MALLDKLKRKSIKGEQKPAAEKKEAEVKQVAPKKALPVDKKRAGLAYKIIKEPHITEKATFLAEANKYVFKVYFKANKSEIKKAVQSLYGVRVKNVNLVHLPGKKRRLRMSTGWRHGYEKGYKKAIVTLEKGEKIDIIPR